MSASDWQIFVEVPGKAPIELAMGEAVIGRSRSAAVQIAESTVSRQHAVLVVEPGVVRLKDLGSSNGTYVNGKRVDGSTGLSDGDKIVVGEAELLIRILPPLGPAEATQRLKIPPLSEPMAATPPTPPAPPIPPTPAVPEEPVESAVRTSPAQPATSFRRTPTPPPEPPRGIDPFAAAAAAPRLAPAVALPAFPPAPPRATPPPAGDAPLEGKKAGELLPSIRDIEKAPVPPPAPRKTAVPDRGQPAGFWIRFAAYLLDMIPMVVLVALSVALAYFVSSAAGMLISLLQFAYGALLVVVMPALYGNTPGKRLLKLQIVTEPPGAGPGLGWGPALLRLVGHLVCSLTFGLGYLLVAFTAQKQGLHDLIAKTRVVRRK